MAIYLVQLALFIIFRSFIKNKKNRDIVFLAFVFFILSIVSGLRNYNVGTDTGAYRQAYIDYIAGITINMEIGFLWFLDLLTKISKDPAVLVIISSVIITAGICYFVFKNSKNPFMSIWLYFTLYMYFISFNAIRQFMGISILLVAYTFAKEKKLIKFLLLCIFATLFHSISIVGFIIYPLCNIKMSGIKLAIISLLSFSVVFFYIFLVNFLIHVFPHYSRHLDTLASNRGGVMSIIVYGCFFLLITFLKPKAIKCKWNDLYVFTVLAAAGGLLNLYIAGAMRVFYLFNHFLIIALPEALETTTRLDIKLKYALYYLLYFTTFIYMLYFLSHNWHYVLPFSFR